MLNEEWHASGVANDSVPVGPGSRQISAVLTFLPAVAWKRFSASAGTVQAHFKTRTFRTEAGFVLGHAGSEGNRIKIDRAPGLKSLKTFDQRNSWQSG